MKALLLRGDSHWKDMKVENVEPPKPCKGEVLIEVHAAGLNPVDYKTASNGHPDWSYPHILGLDSAGIIRELGEGVTEWSIGDPVVYHGDLTRDGAFAEYNITTAHTISRIPEGVSFVNAAALPTAGYTAFQALHRKLPLDQTETLLIHAGAGGVGGFGIQLAKAAGKTVISTASSHNHDHVRLLGADFVIDYRNEEVEARVMDITEGRGVDAVVDTVSSQNATESLGYLAHMGHLVYIAGAPDFSKVKPFTQVISYHEIALGAIHKADMQSQEDLRRMGATMLDMVRHGKLETLVSEIVDLDNVPEALERLADRHVSGKIVAKLK
ncbi:zinc-binding dehydrogenase [Halobacillus halophilus]|uniref:zinc-binding dehydrogenase n=1 Tax=Halobacillus halophilus TaxID=1570 RepID=UPI001CD75679|nr:zinc-binding dehydrogenase [Halobacillus halophilus]MCA1011150.1 zinc-binding dehydrogenase [Halobacillus halophilus]